MTNTAIVIAMHGLLRLLSGRGEGVTASRARPLYPPPPPPPRIQHPGAGLIRWAPPGELPAA